MILETSKQALNNSKGLFKADRVFTTTDWKGVERTVYEATVGNSTYQCFSIEALKERVENHKEVNVDASSYYGQGRYNGD